MEKRNYYHAPRVKSGSQGQVTEQHHAEGLNIKNMMHHGFTYDNRTPVYADLSEMPDLAHMLNNRRRLLNTFENLPSKVKKNVGTIDNYVRLLADGDQDKLMEMGIIKKSDEFKAIKKDEAVKAFLKENPDYVRIDSEPKNEPSGSE